MTVSAIHRHHDGTIQALDETGWFQVRAGDAVDFGDGVILSIDGPSQMAGGSLKLCIISVLIGLVTLFGSRWFHFGGGS